MLKSDCHSHFTPIIFRDEVMLCPFFVSQQGQPEAFHLPLFQASADAVLLKSPSIIMSGRQGE